jgi:hypothetical protein
MAATLEDELIKKMPRAIVHLRAQSRADRFGLIFGAGISIDLGYRSGVIWLQRSPIERTLVPQRYGSAWKSKAHRDARSLDHLHRSRKCSSVNSVSAAWHRKI